MGTRWDERRNPCGVASPIAGKFLRIRVHRCGFNRIGQICDRSQTDDNRKRDERSSRVRYHPAGCRGQTEERSRLEHCHHWIFGSIKNLKRWRWRSTSRKSARRDRSVRSRKRRSEKSRIDGPVPRPTNWDPDRPPQAALFTPRRRKEWMEEVVYRFEVTFHNAFLGSSTAQQLVRCR
jgi:hypothetical protein